MKTTSWPWNALDIEPGADERAVRRAYARVLKSERPDEDPEAFQRLRSAYELALTLAQNASSEAIPAELRERDDVSVVTRTSAETVDETQAFAGRIATELRDPVDVGGERIDARTAPRMAVEVHQEDPVQEAIRCWRRFVTAPVSHRSRAEIRDLLGGVVSFAVRDELEWQAVLYCAREDASPALRVILCDVLDWREDHKRLLVRDAGIANMALARAFADDDYETLSLRYPLAIAFLEDAEGMQNRMKRIVFHLFNPDLEREMTALIASLHRHYRNVLQYRIDASLIDVWQQRQSWRVRAIGLLLSLPLQALWFGFLVASASTMRGRTESAWHGPWGALQIALVFIGAMTYLLGVYAVSPLTSEQRARLQVLREKALVRFGWVVLWVVTIAVAAATGPSGNGTTVVAATLAACTLWASAAHGLMPVGRLFFPSMTYAVGFGFLGHWASIDRPLWILAFAHGVLVAHFLSFNLGPLRAMVVGRPRLSLSLCFVWFAAVVAFLMQLQSGESQANQYAWALFSVLVPVISGMLTGGLRSPIGEALPFPTNHVLIFVYLAVVGLVTPNLAAGVALLFVSVRVVGEIRRVRKEIKGLPA